MPKTFVSFESEATRIIFRIGLRLLRSIRLESSLAVSVDRSQRDSHLNLQRVSASVKCRLRESPKEPKNISMTERKKNSYHKQDDASTHFNGMMSSILRTYRRNSDAKIPQLPERNLDRNAISLRDNPIRAFDVKNKIPHHEKDQIRCFLHSDAPSHRRETCSIDHPLAQ